MTPSQIQSYLLWLNKGNPPGSLGDAFLGGPWPLGFSEGLFLTPEEFGAIGDDSTDDTAAIDAWLAQILATGLPGYMRKWYRCTSPINVNLTSQRTTGIKIFGAGINQCGFDCTAASSAPAFSITSSSDAFYSVFVDFGVRAEIAGIGVQIGDTNYTGPFNSFILRLGVTNSSTSSSAVGTQINSLLDSDVYLVTNCAGHGDALQCRQTQFCTLAGSFSTADIGLHFLGGYSFANTWLNVDIENVGICVQSDVPTASKQTFIGGQFVWNGAAAVVLNQVSNYFRFLGTNPGVAGIYIAGAAAAQGIWEDLFLGTEPSGGLLLKPPTGDAIVQIDASVNQSAGFQFKTAGVIQWAGEMNNASPSSFLITRYSAGSAVDNPLAINASTGIVMMVDGVSINGVGPGTGSWSLWGSAPLTSPAAPAGNSNPVSAGTLAAMLYDTPFTGGVGSTAYTLGTLIAALKSTGLIESWIKVGRQ